MRNYIIYSNFNFLVTSGKFLSVKFRLLCVGHCKFSLCLEIPMYDNISREPCSSYYKTQIFAPLFSLFSWPYGNLKMSPRLQKKMHIVACFTAYLLNFSPSYFFNALNLYDTTGKYRSAKRA